MRLLPQLATLSWTGPNGFHCQVVINVFPAPSYVSFLLSCILVSWESIHTPLPSVGQGEAPTAGCGKPSLGVHIHMRAGTDRGTGEFAGLTH